MAILVTGAAGFIGNHVSLALLQRGEQVVGIDNVNDYYDVTLKEARLARIAKDAPFELHRLNVADKEGLEKLVSERPDIEAVIHLAAQAGVRYSLIDPYAYITSNVMGQVVMLEACRKLPNLKHFVYASSSSVYGGNKVLPFSVDDRVDNPVSLYAATKKSDELIGHCYAHLYGIPQTGLRFFTVYGPWGRPDMAAFIFTKKILEGEPIAVFNHGKMQRDFTYIDDIVSGVLAALDRPPVVSDSGAPAKVYNLGNHRSEELGHFIATLEKALGKEAIKDYQPLQPGDVPATYADIEASQKDLGFEPKTSIEEGLQLFVDWYLSYYKKP